MHSKERLSTILLSFLLAATSVFGLTACGPKQPQSTLTTPPTKEIKPEPKTEENTIGLCATHECAQVRYATDIKGNILMEGDEPLFEGYSKTYYGTFGRKIETYVIFDRPVTRQTITGAVPLLKTDNPKLAKSLATKIRALNEKNKQLQPATTQPPLIVMKEENIKALGGTQKIQEELKTEPAELQKQLLAELAHEDLLRVPKSAPMKLSHKKLEAN